MNKKASQTKRGKTSILLIDHMVEHVTWSKIVSALSVSLAHTTYETIQQ